MKRFSAKRPISLCAEKHASLLGSPKKRNRCNANQRLDVLPDQEEVFSLS
jgi:hypothetical protein